MVAVERSPEVLTHWKKKSTPICGKLKRTEGLTIKELWLFCTKDLNHNGVHAAMVAWSDSISTLDPPAEETG